VETVKPKWKLKVKTVVILFFVTDAGFKWRRIWRRRGRYVVSK